MNYFREWREKKKRNSIWIERSTNQILLLIIRTKNVQIFFFGLFRFRFWFGSEHPYQQVSNLNVLIRFQFRFGSKRPYQQVSNLNVLTLFTTWTFFFFFNKLSTLLPYSRSLIKQNACERRNRVSHALTSLDYSKISQRSIKV